MVCRRTMALAGIHGMKPYVFRALSVVVEGPREHGEVADI